MIKKLLYLCIAVTMVTSCNSDDPEDILTTKPDVTEQDVVSPELKTRIDAYTYPPIGGCAVAKIVETDNHDYQIAFGSGGDFTIKLEVNKSDKEDEWFAINDKNNVVGTPTITIEDADGQFLKAPKVQTNGEIFGGLRVGEGVTSCISVSVEVVTSASPQSTKTLTRKIYVTQKYGQ